MNGISKQMNAAVLHGLGQVPRYESFAAPLAGDGEAVVTVAAAALKPSDRLMAAGVHYAPTAFPQVVGLDGVGRLADGSRVAFFLPRAPYGGMAEQTLVRAGAWLPVPAEADDVTAAAVLNPGGAAWKTVFWEGELEAGQSVLILGATGISGRIAAQLAARQGARVVVAGRNGRVLEQLVAGGSAAAAATAAVQFRRPAADLVAELVAAGPYDLVVDYVWGEPAGAAFEALAQLGTAVPRVRYVLVGMTAGETAMLPALTLRRAPIELIGSGFRGPATLEAATEGFHGVLDLIAQGDLDLDIEPVPLSDVEKVWPAATSGRRIVFVP